MRLRPAQINTILDLAHEVMGEGVAVSVFGSRLDDHRRGGDLDLFVETAYRPTRLQRAELKFRLENALAIPVDIVVHTRGTVLTPFQALAMTQGVPLELMQ